MNYHYLNFNNQNGLIEGVVLRRLIVHQDVSGSLMETLRTDWIDVSGQDFAMQYLSITPPAVARDEDKWHFHQKQHDRFICIRGRIVTAIFDPRKNSPTSGQLNLFVMSPQKEEETYMVVILRQTYHGFLVVSRQPGYLLNFPTCLYNPADEGRVTNSQLSWQKVREDFKIG